ncbi:MAG: hypothetical protein AAGI51_04570 [Pseudomonadota bacterium]
MFRSLSRPILAAAALGGMTVLAGCAPGAGGGGVGAGGTRVHSTIIETNYTPSEIGGQLPVVVLGAPPDGSPPEAVAAQMRVPQVHGGQPMTLVAPATVRGPRVVVSFGGGSRSTICRGEARSMADPGPSMNAMVAYCFNQTLSSSAIMASGATQGPQDAAFAGAMMQAVREILPARNPAQDPSRGRARPRPRR